MISRRAFLGFAGLLPMGGAIAQSSSGSVKPYSDRAIADAWILESMASPQAATRPLHLGRFADAMYFLRERCGWTPNKGQEAHKPVNVPAGFVTDFASIPRVFWTILPKDGTYTYAAIVHDYLYWEQPVSRDEADLILRFAMEDFKVEAAKIRTIYAGVTLGGGAAWKENAEHKARGEKRILRRYPEDPKIRWEQWRKTPGVLL